MAGDTVGSGETFDGSDAHYVPDVMEPGSAPDYVDPVAEAAATVPNQELEDIEGELSDFEPEDGDTTRPASVAPAVTTRDQQAEIDGELDDSDYATARARDEADRPVLPSEQTQARFKHPVDSVNQPAVQEVSPAKPEADHDTDGEQDENGQGSPATAVAAIGHTAVEDEVDTLDQGADVGIQDSVAAEDGKDHSNVEEVDEVISGHNRDLAADGREKIPDIDLQELEDLLELIDPDSALIMSQHNWTDGDDSWTRAPDAANNSGETEEIENPEAALDKEIQDGQDNVVHSEFTPVTGDDYDTNDQPVEEQRNAPIMLLRRDPEPAKETQATGDWIDDALPEMPEGERDDTPQGSRPYPPELVEYTDTLMMQGDDGEEQAMQLLEHFDSTGQLPEWLVSQPAQSPKAADEVPQVDAPQPLF